MAERNDPRLDELRRRLRERGNRLPPDALRFARAVMNQPDDELTHEECMDDLPACVDAVLEGARLADKYPAVKRHLDACDECEEQYAELLEISLEDEAGQIPMPAVIPAPDLSFLPSPIPLWEYIKQKAAEILAALAPAQMEDFQAIADIFFKRVESSGGKFVLRPVLLRSDARSSQVDEALAALAVTYAATNAIITSFTPEQIDSLAARDLLCARIEKRAKAAALKIKVKPTLARKIAKQFALQTCSDPASLRRLIQQHKR